MNKRELDMRRAEEHKLLEDMMKGNQAWARNRSTHRFSVRLGTKLVVWCTKYGKTLPEALGWCRVRHIGLDCGRGVLVGYDTHIEKCADAYSVISGVPTKVLDSFLWVPTNTCVRYSPLSKEQWADSCNNVAVTVCANLPTNPHKVIVSDLCYITPEDEFNKLWGAAV